MEKALSNRIYWILILFLISCQHVPNRMVAGDRDGTSKKQIKTYFRSIDKASRQSALENAEVFLEDWRADQVSKIDLVEDYLKKNCDPTFEYRKGSKIIWPEVTCKYRQDDPLKPSLGGGSPKFLCDFENEGTKDDLKKIQIKYTLKTWNGYTGEVLEVLAATHIALLLGLPVNYYCPVKVSCQGCSSEDPWSDEHASASPSGKTYRFDFAMLEKNFSGPTISDTAPDAKAPRGVSWSESKEVQKKDPARARSQLIEREAWILWHHFIHHGDANDSNRRLACEKVILEGDTPQCARPVIFANDYGHVFAKPETRNDFNLLGWNEHGVFQFGTQDLLCRGVVSKKKTSQTVSPRDSTRGLFLDARISEEAKQLLVSRLELISEEQWRTIYRLALSERANSKEEEAWIKSARSKIAELKSTTCPSFDSGKTVLSSEY